VKNRKKWFTQTEIVNFGVPAGVSKIWEGKIHVGPFRFDERDQMLPEQKEETLKKVRLSYL
jgi:hypothetical protein